MKAPCFTKLLMIYFYFWCNVKVVDLEVSAISKVVDLEVLAISKVAAAVSQHLVTIRELEDLQLNSSHRWGNRLIEKFMGTNISIYYLWVFSVGLTVVYLSDTLLRKICFWYFLIKFDFRRVILGEGVIIHYM